MRKKFPSPHVAYSNRIRLSTRIRWCPDSLNARGSFALKCVHSMRPKRAIVAATCLGPEGKLLGRAEKRLRMRAVDSFRRIQARFRSFDQWKFTALDNVVLAGDFLAITTLDKMELDEFWEKSNSIRSLWHTELISREYWLFRNSKAAKY